MVLEPQSEYAAAMSNIKNTFEVTSGYVVLVQIFAVAGVEQQRRVRVQCQSARYCGSF